MSMVLLMTTFSGLSATVRCFTMTDFLATMGVLATVDTGEMEEMMEEYWQEVAGVLVAFLAMSSSELKWKLGEEMALRLGEEQRKSGEEMASRLGEEQRKLE